MTSRSSRRVRVRLYASLAEAVGPVLELDVPDGARVGDLARLAAAARPELAGTEFGVATAERWLGADEPLPDRDDLALLPPVSGG